MLAQRARTQLNGIEGLQDFDDNPFPTLTAFLNPDSLKEAELDAMAEADALIAREDSTGESQPLR
jgi:hypothetical protein